MRLSTIALAGVLWAPAAGGQGMHGRVVGHDSAAVAGAVVTLLDARGTPLARALADEAGRFNFRMPAAGEYRVEVLRVGHAPTLDPPFRVAEGEVAQRVVVANGAAAQLPREFAGDDACLGATPAPLPALAWGEVRKALIATQLTRLTRAYTMDVDMYVSRQSADRTIPPTIDRSSRSRTALRTLSSVPPATLASEGYLTRGPSGDRYHAPDDEVLLSDSFAATHCVRLLGWEPASTTIRLGFAPSEGRRQPDIRGVITLDRASLELRRVDFVYVNLRPTEYGADPHAGEVHFRRLPEGSWIIDGWALALPFVEQYVRQQGTPATVNRRGVAAPARPAVVLTGQGRLISGGGVTGVRFGDEVVWQTEELPMPRDPVPLPSRP